MRHSFRYQKGNYFNVNGDGYCEKSLLSKEASLFEFYALVINVRVRRKDVSMSHNVMSVNTDLQDSKFQPVTSTIMEVEPTGLRKVCLYCLCEVRTSAIVQHCADGCGPHYVHGSCWKEDFCRNDMRTYETYAWLHNTGQDVIPSVRQAMCCPSKSSLVMVNVIDNDGVIQQRFKPPCGSSEVSTWDDIFRGLKERVQFVNAVIESFKTFALKDELAISISAVSIEDHLPDAFPRNSLSSELWTM